NLKVLKSNHNWHKVNGSLEVVSALPRLPKTPTKGWTKKPKRTNTNDKEILEEDTSLLDVLPTEVVEAGGNNAELLSCTYDHFVVEEIVNCNTDEEIWANALIDVIDQVDDLNDNENTEEHAFEMIENLCKEQTEISENTNNEETDRINLHGQDYDRILGMLQTDKNANKTKKWDSENAETVQKMLSCDNTLKIARDVDLRVVVRYLKQCKNIIIKEYATKAVKLSELTKHLSLNGEIKENTHIKASRNKPKDVKPLSILAASALKSVPKNVLNISFAEYIWPDRLEQWQKNSPTDGIDVTGFEKPDFFFYVPEYSLTRHQLEVRSIDSTHLLTRTRRKTCKGGIEGFTNEPWLKVARQGKSLLTPAMVEEIVDPMSMSMANTHFSQAVQNAMQENGDFRAASLCADILDWWRAEDEAGISATERMSMRFKLRRRLLGLINFGEFPPPGQYVKGWPTQLFEALLANIDAKLLLYSLCKSGTYNSRAFSSMMGETFFSEMTHQDRAGHGVISCDEFSKYIGKTTEQLQARLDTSRTFVYRTSTKVKAYDPVSSDMNLEDLPLNDYTTESLDSDRFHIRHIKLKDHFFDSEERRRRAGTRRHGTVSTNRNALQKGSLGVRWYRARRDDSKLLPTKKLGI
ncbi:uncharacterized protein LOC132730724, partial [Ruditapes philippinarum]|uniref:uncharacterized protein LOC132730724 n=1 Tax=Ruditapes philippinarum TaxID=129788 RepID=UPI00295B5D13